MKEWLFFKLISPWSWLIFSAINPQLKIRLKKYARGKMVDIGCGEKPYGGMTAEYVKDHVGIDHISTRHDKSSIDLFSTAYKIAVKDESFDCVLCTDVLEHLEEPSQAIAEAYRILRKGSYAIYTVPLFWHLHEKPRDFYRYTEFGLRYLFDKNGFEVIEIKALSGFWLTFGQEFVYYLLHLWRGGWLHLLLWLIFFVPILLLMQLIQIIAYLANKVDWSKDFTIEYIAVVKKPE